MDRDDDWSKEKKKITGMDEVNLPSKMTGSNASNFYSQDTRFKSPL